MTGQRGHQSQYDQIIAEDSLNSDKVDAQQTKLSIRMAKPVRAVESASALFWRNLNIKFTKNGQCTEVKEATRFTKDNEPRHDNSQL